jgi:AraC family transcriptional activator of pobA
LRAIEAQSHFEARVWHLSAGAAGELDHGVLLHSGEASLEGQGEPLLAIGPAFAWVPARSADRLVIAAGGAGQILAIRRDLIEHAFRLFPESGAMLDLLSAVQPLVLGIEESTVAQIARTMSLISNELHEHRPGAQTVISSALVIALVLLWRHVGVGTLTQQGLAGAAQMLMRFRQLVEERYREHWSVEQYAGALGIKPDRLHAICTRLLGRSPSVLVQQRILNEAVARLERSAITIKQLSFMLGFKDAAYFNRFFAHHMGVPPGRYRRERLARTAVGRPTQTTFAFSDWP